MFVIERWQFLNGPDWRIYISRETILIWGLLMKNRENQLTELSVLNLRVLRLENCVILMCEKCGETWNPDVLNSWACPKGCNRF